MEAFGKKGHHEATCRDKKATSHKLDCFHMKNDEKTSPIEQQTWGIGRKGLYRVVHTIMLKKNSTIAS
jgi:hypothetical protein